VPAVEEAGGHEEQETVRSNDAADEVGEQDGVEVENAAAV